TAFAIGHWTFFVPPAAFFFAFAPLAATGTPPAGAWPVTEKTSAAIATIKAAQETGSRWRPLIPAGGLGFIVTPTLSSSIDRQVGYGGCRGAGGGARRGPRPRRRPRSRPAGRAPGRGAAPRRRPHPGRAARPPSAPGAVAPRRTPAMTR